MAINTYTKKVKDIIDLSPLPLPIGYRDSSGEIHRSVEIKDMTGVIDEAVADPKVRNNGGKIITEVVAGVLVSIGGIEKPTKADARKMFGADRELILLANYHNSVATNPTVEWEETCPSCRKSYDVEVNYMELDVRFLEGDNHIMELELPRGVSLDGGKTYHKKMKVTFPNGEVQERVSQAMQMNPGSAITTIISMCAEDVEGLTSWNYDTFKNMVKKDRNAVGQFLNEQHVGVDMTSNSQCPNCGFEHKVAIPARSLMGE